ncbi:MAG: DUF1156 domain-containing protein [Deltaproteobacteria bacterium]|nr:DUF1156 domain-containing protein [Deltaproteobacteria bacterium]
MIPKGCKRLAEVDFPMAVVSKHSAREKSIRHGHPSTLHLWWEQKVEAASSRLREVKREVKAALYNRDVQVAPAAILWPDKEGQWSLLP